MAEKKSDAQNKIRAIKFWNGVCQVGMYGWAFGSCYLDPSTDEMKNRVARYDSKFEILKKEYAHWEHMSKIKPLSEDEQNIMDQLAEKIKKHEKAHKIGARVIYGLTCFGRGVIAGAISSGTSELAKRVIENIKKSEKSSK